mgnify:CR=1 FL=1
MTGNHGRHGVKDTDPEGGRYSYKAEISARRVVITAGGDRVPYARAHNEGFSGSVVVRSHERVSRKGKPYVVKQHARKMLIPRRRFMGESRELETLIKKDVEQLFKNAMER